MAKRPRNTRSAQRQPQRSDSIFDHFARHRPEMLPPEAPTATSAAPRPRDYGREIADLKRQNEELQRQLSTPAIPRAPTVTKQTVEAKDVRFSMDGLPDPVTEPDKYNQEVERRFNAALEARSLAASQRAEAESASQQQSNALWSQFSELYPDWAEDQEKVRFAAEAVINAAKAKGLDTEAYITTFSSQFCKDVASKLEQTFGPLESDEDDGDEDVDDGFDEGFGEDDDGFEDEVPRNRSRKVDPNDDDGRTAGIFGGMESGGRPARGKTEPKGDMITDLIDVQRKSGFF